MKKNEYFKVKMGMKNSIAMPICVGASLVSKTLVTNTENINVAQADLSGLLVFHRKGL